MEKVEVIEIAPPTFEDVPRDPALRPGGDVSAEEWRKAQQDKK